MLDIKCPGIQRSKSLANPHLFCPFFSFSFELSHVKENCGGVNKHVLIMWNVLLSLVWFRVQISVCSAEWSSHISIFHSQLHHHAYEEQQTSRKQRECSPPVFITAWLLTQHIHFPHIILVRCVQKWLRQIVLLRRHSVELSTKGK